jgi:hypothetical protein
MKVLRTTLSFLALGLLAFSSASAQKVVAPPPKPADSGPSLSATMQFIQTRLNELGNMYYAAYVHDNATGKDWTEQVSVETRNLIADSATCSIHYHLKNTVNGPVTYDHDESFNLHDVQSLEVRTGIQHRKRLDAGDGHPTWDARMDPPLFVLVIRQSGKDTDWFYFFDEDTASRVAKAMLHAVELCGGGNKDPF